MARARWFETIDELQGRTSASGLAEEAWEGVRNAGNALAEKAVDTAKKKPGITVAIGSGLALFFLRKPIASALRKRMARRKETKLLPESLDRKEKPAEPLKSSPKRRPSKTKEFEDECQG